MKMLNKLAIAMMATVSFVAVSAAQDMDPRIPGYKPTTGVSGKVKSIGSDTLNNLMALWAEDFKKLYPGVAIEVEGKGSSTAPPALLAGSADMGPMSRPMKPAEIDAFQSKYGYKPTEVRVAVDALGVFVHKDNPVDCLSIAQLDGIFSSTQKTGAKNVTTWGEVGGTGEWAGKAISLFGRNSASGTYGYFKEVAMGNGDYKATVKEQPGSSAVVQGVAADKFAIGYSGIGYKTADVKAIKVSGRDGQCKEPSKDNAYEGTYPISRFLYIYVNKNPGAPLAPAVGQFFNMILSKEGQTVVVKDGYFPMPYVFLAEERQKLGF